MTPFQKFSWKTDNITTTTLTNSKNNIINRPYECTVEITFLSRIDAQRAIDALSMDSKVSECATKYFKFLPCDEENETFNSILEM